MRVWARAQRFSHVVSFQPTYVLGCVLNAYVFCRQTRHGNIAKVPHSIAAGEPSYKGTRWSPLDEVLVGSKMWSVFGLKRYRPTDERTDQGAFLDKHRCPVLHIL